MSESDTDTYTVSFKTSGGYDASLIVVRGNTPQELADNITALHEDVVSLVVDTENLVHVAYSAKAPAVATVTEINPAAGSTVVQTSNEVVMMCPHGKRTRRDGNGAKGYWAGYFCPLPKGDANQCKPEWEDRK